MEGSEIFYNKISAISAGESTEGYVGKDAFNLEVTDETDLLYSNEDKTLIHVFIGIRPAINELWMQYRYPREAPIRGRTVKYQPDVGEPIGIIPADKTPYDDPRFEMIILPHIRVSLAFTNKSDVSITPELSILYARYRVKPIVDEAKTRALYEKIVENPKIGKIMTAGGIEPFDMPKSAKDMWGFEGVEI